MNQKILSSTDSWQYAIQQFHSLEKKLRGGEMEIAEVGDLVHASVMVQDILSNVPNQVAYMNDWGCERLGHSLEEIQDMGAAYYSRFFVQEQMQYIQHCFSQYILNEDAHDSFHFHQLVKTRSGNEADWYFTMCKFIAPKLREEQPTKLLVVSSPVADLEQIRKQLDLMANQNIYRMRHFAKFQALTKREKEIITLLAEGCSAREIADRLFISLLTVETHRKNIRKKLDINNFAGIIKFALAFDLITY